MPEEIEHIDTIGKVKASVSYVCIRTVLHHSLIPKLGILLLLNISLIISASGNLFIDRIVTILITTVRYGAVYLEARSYVSTLLK
jgi:hypothetical protein